ncbi:MAG: outer membrane protein assembly factor BamE [Alphaproteobacteria bacterium]
MFQTPKKAFLLSSCVLLLGAGACAPVVHQRGNLVEDFQMQQIKPLESTRSDVLRDLGSPTTKSTFDPNVWYYIGQETEKRGILDPEVVQERIVLVAFNEEGFVETIKDIDRERLNIPYSRDKTPTHGNETTIMQQFLGNLGKFNPNAGQQ